MKVQYPGVGDAIETDLDNTEGLYRLVGAFALKGLDTKALVDELRDRMRDELDYRLEAANQREFAPALRRPPVRRASPRSTRPPAPRGCSPPSGSTASASPSSSQRATPAATQRAGESIWRFAQHAVHRARRVQRRPAPRQLPLHATTATVTFLDFGLVKRWSARRVGAAAAEHGRDHRAPRPGAAARRRWRRSGFLQPGHGLDAEAGVRLRQHAVPAVPHRHGSRSTRDFVKRHDGHDHRRQRPARRR